MRHPEHAAAALEAYGRAVHDDDPRCLLLDLLADLRHWVDEHADELRDENEPADEIDAEELWNACLLAGLDHYAYEVDPANAEELAAAEASLL